VIFYSWNIFHEIISYDHATHGDKKEFQKVNMSQQSSRVPVRVLIVEDDAVTRRSLCMAVESEPALALAAAFDSVEPTLDWLKCNAPDILLTDLGLPDGSGLDVIRCCVQRYPDCDIMVLTMSSDEDQVLACIEAGAAGYVLKDARAFDIVRALLDLHAGGSPISPPIARKILARLQTKKNRRSSVQEPESLTAGILTRRETAILDLIARGDSYGDVAKLLSVSVGTVQTHVKNIYGKLCVHSRGEAVYEAQRRGLLQMKMRRTRP
jgi:DNA-binding NarL/FixJ family response regulator